MEVNHFKKFSESWYKKPTKKIKRLSQKIWTLDASTTRCC